MDSLFMMEFVEGFARVLSIEINSIFVRLVISSAWNVMGLDNLTAFLAEQENFSIKNSAFQAAPQKPISTQPLTNV
jgi:uncharacterized protein YqfB (UPF0267 family)